MLTHPKIYSDYRYSITLHADGKEEKYIVDIVDKHRDCAIKQYLVTDDNVASILHDTLIEKYLKYGIERIDSFKLKNELDERVYKYVTVLSE
jgi:hypothetical protein